MAKLAEVRLYYVDSDAVAPEETSRAVGAEVDAAGRRIYENTHYGARAAAWGWLIRDVDAQQRLAAREISRLRAELARAEKEAANAVVRRVAIVEGMEKNEA